MTSPASAPNARKRSSPTSVPPKPSLTPHSRNSKPYQDSQEGSPVKPTRECIGSTLRLRLRLSARYALRAPLVGTLRLTPSLVSTAPSAPCQEVVLGRRYERRPL